MADDFWRNTLYQKDSELVSRSYNEEFHLENGRYENICINCQECFIGYKRRITCKLCRKPYVAKPQRFTRSEDGKQIFDDDFTYDAKLRISGDFGTDEELIQYTDELCERLNRE